MVLFPFSGNVPFCILFSSIGCHNYNSIFFKYLDFLTAADYLLFAVPDKKERSIKYKP